MDDFQVENAKAIVAHEQRIVSLERRMECVEDMSKNLSQLTTSVAVLVEKTNAVATDTGQIKLRLNILEDRPAKSWENLKGYVITLIVGGIITYILTKVLGG